MVLLRFLRVFLIFSPQEVLQDQPGGGETQTVQFTLTADDWSVYYPQIGKGLKKIAEDSEFWVAIKPETDCDVYNETAIRSSLCSNFTLSTGEYPFGTIDIPW